MSELTSTEGMQGDSESSRVGAVRIAIGFAQGLALYALSESVTHKVWPATQHETLAALGAALIFGPLVLIFGLRAFRPRVLGVWSLGAAAIAAGLIAYSVWRTGGGGDQTEPFTVFVIPAIPITLFIANHLIEGSEIDRRWIAAYPNYFDPAWKHGVQIVLAVMFTAVFWGLLFLGAGLFTLIHVSFLIDLIRKPWFAGPATGMALAAAIHLTDVRAGLVRGVRTVALTLLSWLLPLLVLLTGAFLLTLPFTGLTSLWKTKAAAAILLTAASQLVLLINATYQDGTEPPAGVLRWAVRAASLILVPLVAIASIGIGLRVQQYGLTPERIIAGCWALIAASYALGYALAALLPGGWMKPLERTNVVGAWLILVVIAALFTPIADPARLSVADQVHRLDTGKTKPEAFDYAFLRFRSARYGREALAKLAARKGTAMDADVAERAAKALKRQNAWEVAAPKPAVLVSHLTVYPKGAVLPEGFATQDWAGTGDYNPCLQSADKCDAYLVDLDGDGAPEVLLGVFGQLKAYHRGPDGTWSLIGDFPFGGCDDLIKTMQAGNLHAVPAPPHSDLDLNGVRLTFSPQSKPIACKANAAGKPAKPR